MKIIKINLNGAEKAVKQNEGYCPCKLDKTPETRCMCCAFRELEEGICDCGLYEKIID